MKLNKSKKIKLITLTSGLAVLLATSIAVTSCGPSAQVINNLFPTSSSNGFVNAPDVSTKDLVTKSLMTSTGFDSFLKVKLSDVLGTWYKNNANSSMRTKYQNFVAVVDNDWKNLINDLKKSHGNDYLVELQKTYLDQNGGTEATYKQTKINEKVLEDFSNSLFSTLYLSYLDTNNKPVTPSRTDLDNESNWSKLKFTNPVTGAYDFNDESNINNVNETFAQIQGDLFKTWVNEENPNLLSSVLFTNGTPRNNGLDLLFNKDVIGAETLTASYAFQVMENNLSDLTTTKGASAYKKIVTEGLSKYVGDNGKIDFSLNLTQGTSTKVIMTANNMFSGDDVTIPAGFIQQYLSMINDPNKDNIGPEVDLLGTNTSGTSNSAVAQADTEDKYNVMGNFIRDITSSTSKTVAKADATASTTQETTTPETAYTKVDPKFTNAKNSFTNTFYDAYKKLATTNGDATTKDNPKNTTTHGIFNVIKPKSTTSTGTSSVAATDTNATDKNKNFILIRSNDGVHLMGIDGGSYYLSSMNNGTNGQSKTVTQGRDLVKQENFLKYRSALLTWGNLPSDQSYDFNLKDLLSKWFNDNKTRLIFSVLSDAIDHKNAFADTQATNNQAKTPTKNFFDLNANQAFKNEFTQLKTDISDYVTKYDAYAKASKLQSNVNTISEKLNARAKTYSDFESASTPEKIGMAARLPYVRQNDGVYAGLSRYYTNGALSIDSTSSTQKDANAQATDPYKSIADAMRTNIDNTYKALKTSTESMVDKMGLSIANSSDTPYAQVLFVKTSSGLYDLAFNSVLQTTANTTAVTNTIKYSYFKNNSNLNNLYNFDDGSIKQVYGIAKEKLEQIVNTYYWMPFWYGSSSRYSYGGYQDQTGLDKIISTVKNLQSITVNPTSDSAISYYTFLYTLDWLLRDDLVNLKFILNQSIFEGTNAAITWTMNMDPSKLGTENPFTQFAANPNFLQGSSSNWYNAVSSNTQASGTQKQAAAADTTTSTPPKPDPFNDTANPYYYTNTYTTIANGSTSSGSSSAVTTVANGTTPNKLYGFNGIVLENDSSIDSNVTNQLFGNFGSTGVEGSLSSFGSQTNLLAYLERIQSLTELDKLVTMLETRAKIDLSAYHQKDQNGNFILTFDQKKELVKSKIPPGSATTGTKTGENYYKKFSGFIGNKKVAVDLYGSNGNDWKTKIQESDPVVENGKSTRVAAYAMQINYEDVNNLGGQGWVTDNPTSASAKRLGLDLDTFLAIVGLQASNTIVQNLATNDLINNNKKPAGSDFSRYTVGDKRIYDALTDTWVTKPKK
ncbi:DUF3713 domain-containing protein [Mycoplasmoides alvi]|uniref:DUF3713 domain-containing protein n=1 Tax=Mycoplasmoides alvi TaxID=78580 RepID=UPI00051BE2AF|nr:DUF3713 domain-containing protein [Mycoplasmoides alvi]